MSWSSGICGCFEDINTCALTYFCPCVVAGKNAEAVGENCFLHGFLSTLGCVGIFCGAKIREKIREKHGIEGSFGNDCIMHWFCPLCAYSQEARELKARCPSGQAMARS
ncbi:predicted protein [Nematostella vectensis]|uniref:Uncharacterized protein n=1 Tax=Nematostella vectensis TaxID=45351 RepID=A7RUR8_NEMVE|nr:cell number regulator 11 [Nematostella vectensis]EDO44794.1 predicted protein [Nematostella vectensis]|eukprot:XP_001636857.1 predicted protein [Nematostella vectensis]